MAQDLWIGIIAVVSLAFGLAKALKPQYFLELRKRHSWVNVFDVYAFVFKTKHAETAIRINGYILLLIGASLAAWLVLA
jgi:hypothetical protein